MVAAFVCGLLALGCRAAEQFDPGKVGIGIGVGDGTGGFAGPAHGSGGAAGGAAAPTAGTGGAPEPPGGPSDGTGGAVEGAGGVTGTGTDADAPPAPDAAAPDSGVAELPHGGSELDGARDAGTVDGRPGPNACDRSRWMATASAFTESFRRPALAIDGDLTTHWGSARNQDGTDWFRVDFPDQVRLSTITLNNTRAYPGDYPGGYAVFASRDGVTFTGPIATGAGAMAETVIHFRSTRVRAIRINQTGTDRSGLWWQIGELETDCSPP